MLSAARSSGLEAVAPALGTVALADMLGRACPGRAVAAAVALVGETFLTPTDETGAPTRGATDARRAATVVGTACSFPLLDVDGAGDGPVRRTVPGAAAAVRALAAVEPDSGRAVDGGSLEDLRGKQQAVRDGMH